MQRTSVFTPSQPFRSLVRSLGQAWLRLGANAIELHRDGISIAAWPEDAAIRTPDMMAPLAVNGRTLGELRLAGLYNGSSRSHLETQAELLAHALQLEQDLSLASSALVSARNEVAALRAFAAFPGAALDRSASLSWLASETARLLHTGGAFVWLAQPDASPVSVQYPSPRLSEGQMVDLNAQVAGDSPALVWNGANMPRAFSHQVVDLLCLPLHLGAYAGVLGVWDKDDGGFTPVDLQFARLIADLAAERIHTA